MSRTPYPVTTPERRRIVVRLSDIARQLDAEVEARNTPAGQWNDITRAELARAAGHARFAATAIVQGGMSTNKARFAVASFDSFMRLVQRADRFGVIR